MSARDSHFIWRWTLFTSVVSFTHFFFSISKTIHFVKIQHSISSRYTTYIAYHATKWIQQALCAANVRNKIQKMRKITTKTFKLLLGWRWTTLNSQESTRDDNDRKNDTHKIVHTVCMNTRRERKKKRRKVEKWSTNEKQQKP